MNSNVEEIKQRIELLGNQLEIKKASADSILLDIGLICKEILALQKMLQKKLANDEQDTDQ
jgi:hypothetical protein